MTAQDAIIQALSKLGVIEPGVTPSVDELNDGLVVLNQMLGTWNDVLKRNLAGAYAADYYNFNALTSNYALATTINLSGGWQKAIVYALAIDLAPEYGRTVPPEVGAIAEAAKKAVVTLPVPVI